MTLSNIDNGQVLQQGGFTTKSLFSKEGFVRIFCFLAF